MSKGKKKGKGSKIKKAAKMVKWEEVARRSILKYRIILLKDRIKRFIYAGGFTAILTFGAYVAFRFGHVPYINLTAPGSDPNDHIIVEEIDELPDGEHDDDYFEDVTPEGPSEQEKEDIKDNPHKNDDIDSDNVKKEEEMVK